MFVYLVISYLVKSVGGESRESKHTQKYDEEAEAKLEFDIIIFAYSDLVLHFSRVLETW